MKLFFEDYAPIIGLLLLAFVVILLFATPSMIFAKAVTTIGTELSHATSDEMIVRTKLDFGSTEHMQAFPKQIGNWSAFEYNTTRIAEVLGADVLLMRAYSNPNSYQPVFFLIEQSTNRSSFHPPPVCYRALGYTIEEEAQETVMLHNVTFAQERWMEKDIPSNVTLSVKKIVVAKESEGEGTITERRVVLYFYVKNRPYASNTVTMVRISALAPIEGSYDGILTISKEFMADTIPYMFELQAEQEQPILFTILATGSLTEKLAVTILFLVPLATIFYPQLMMIRRKIQ
jgi:hypothetical protein